MSGSDMPWAPSIRRMREIRITVVHGGGRTQIPEEIRNRLGLRDGDKVVWYERAGEFMMRKEGQLSGLKPRYGIEPNKQELAEILRKRGVPESQIEELLRG